MNKAQLELTSRFKDQDSLNFSVDGRNFITWYSSEDISRIAHLMFRNGDSELQKVFHEPIMIYEAHNINFETKMAYCRSLLKLSGKKLFPFVMAPEIGSCHFMAGLIRKDEDGSFKLFVFNPTGYSKELIKKRLGVSDINNVAEMKLICSSQKIQTIEKDQLDSGVEQASLVSCGPISLMFIQHLLNEPQYALTCNETFELPNSILCLERMSKKEYQEQIILERKRHFDLLGTINDDVLATIDNINAHYIQKLLEFSTEQDTYQYDYPDNESLDEDNQSLNKDNIKLPSKTNPMIMNTVDIQKKKYQDLIFQLEKICHHLIIKTDTNLQAQPKYAQAEFAAKYLISQLNIYGERFFSQTQNRKEIDFFESSCKMSIKTAALELEKHEGWWYHLNPILKAILGVLAVITIIPALAIQCLTKQGYVGTFFMPQKTEASEMLATFETDFNQFLQQNAYAIPLP